MSDIFHLAQTGNLQNVWVFRSTGEHTSTSGRRGIPFQKPTGFSMFGLLCVGSGGGGGGGLTGATLTARGGGGGGGSAAMVIMPAAPSFMLPDTMFIYPAAARGPRSGSGTAGQAGDSSFIAAGQTASIDGRETILTASGGSGGAAGTAAGAAAGGTAGAVVAAASAQGMTIIPFLTIAGNTGGTGGNAVTPTAGSQAAQANATLLGSGAGGGAVSSADATRAGGVGFANATTYIPVPAAGTAGAPTGGDGNAGTGFFPGILPGARSLGNWGLRGIGGSGGGAGSTSTGGLGGDGWFGCGGGGGGGGTTGGTGGMGGDGFVLIWGY